MLERPAKSLFYPALFLFLFLSPLTVLSQQSTVLSGTVSASSGQPVANAKISVTNAPGGQPVTATTDAGGKYSLPPLAPGSYTLSISAPGFSGKETQAAINGAGHQTLDLTLTPASSSQQNLPNAPAAASQQPSLQDLGFTPQQTQGNPQLQARLDKRIEMLKIHQRLGLITLAPMAAALITGPMAKAKGRDGQTIKEPTQANLDFHAALGSATAVMYFTTAYFAIAAPGVHGTHKRGAIRMHEALALIHGPGMILTPVLGAMAFKQEQAGEKVHGIASAHGAVATATVIAYAASIVAVSWPIHLKFWEKK